MTNMASPPHISATVGTKLVRTYSEHHVIIRKVHQYYIVVVYASELGVDVIRSTANVR